MKTKALLNNIFHSFVENRAFTFIFLLGISVRIWNISWGLPELYEEATPLVKAWAMWNWGHPGFQLNPHFFNYPAFTLYLNFFLQLIHYALGRVTGIYPSLESFGAALTSLVVPARGISVLFDLGTIIVVYLFTEKLAGKRTAIIAACLAALNPLLVQQSHLIAVDTPLTFFTILSLYYIYRLTLSPDRTWFVLAGISIGLAMATKYTGALLLPVLLIASLSRATSFRGAFKILKSLNMVTSVFLAIACFIVFNPSIFFSFSEFLRDFSYEQHHIASGHLGLDPAQSTVGYYFLSILPGQLGWLVYGSCIATSVVFLIERQRQRIFLLVFPILYTTVISTWEMRAERYILPIFPVVLMISAIGMVACIDSCNKVLRRWLPKFFSRTVDQTKVSLVMGVIGLIFFVQPLKGVYTFERTIGLPNTRAVAKSWISTHLPNGAALATGPFGIQFSDSMYDIIKIPFRVTESENVAMFYDTRWYEDVDILIASDYDYERYALDPVKYKDFLTFYDSLRTHWKLAYEITPTDAQDGPRFWLYHPLRSSPIFHPMLFEKLHGSTDSLRITNFLHDLTIVLIDKKQWDKCEQTLQEILSVEVENTVARNTLVKILFNEGRYQEALRQVNLSLKVKPGQEEIITLGQIIVQKMKQP